MENVGTLEQRAQMAWRMANAGERMRDRLEEKSTYWASPEWFAPAIAAWHKVGRDVRFCLAMIDRYEQVEKYGWRAASAPRASEPAVELPYPAPPELALAPPAAPAAEPAREHESERERFERPDLLEDPARGLPASLPALKRRMDEHLADLQVICDTADTHTDIYKPPPVRRAVAQARAERLVSLNARLKRRDSS